MEIIYLLTINSVFFISYKLISSYFNKNVSEERIKWRERIRELTIEIVNTDKYEYKLIAELSTRLNLFDDNSDIEIIISGNLKIENEDKHEDKDITKTVAITSSAYNIKDGEEWNKRQIDMFVNLLRNQVMMHSNYNMEANM